MSNCLPSDIIEKAGREFAWIAKHGAREEKSGRFLPPPGWREPEAPASAAKPEGRRARG